MRKAQTIPEPRTGERDAEKEAGQQALCMCLVLLCLMCQEDEIQAQIRVVDAEIKELER